MNLPTPPSDDDVKALFQELLDEQDAPLEEEDSPEPVEDPEQAQQAAERAGEGEVSGYAGPYATKKERDQLARDWAMRERLVRAARRKVPEADVEDVAQEALCAACLAAKLPGGSGDSCEKYVFGVLKYKVAEYWRQRSKRRELAEGAKAQAYFARAVQAADQVADRDLFAKLPTLVKPSQMDDFRCLIRHRVGKETLTALAVERGENYPAFAQRIMRLRKALESTVGVMSGLAVLLIVLCLPRPDRPLAIDEPGPVTVLEPAVSTHVGQTDPMDWARVLRGEAYKACLENHWRECLNDLVAARDLDPDGDRDPIVAAARKDAMDGYTANLKPGSPWKPPVARAYADRASR
jgi:hypothetical protein